MRGWYGSRGNKVKPMKEVWAHRNLDRGMNHPVSFHCNNRMRFSLSAEGSFTPVSRACHSLTYTEEKHSVF